MKMYRFILLLILLLGNCVEEIYSLREPQAGEKPAAIAFGLFIFTSDKELSSGTIKIKMPDHFKTSFFEVSEAGNVVFEFDHGPTKLMKKVEKRKYISAKNILLESNGEKVFYVLSGLNPEKKYLLRSVEYSYTTVQYKANGDTKYRTFYVTLPIHPENSRDVMPITVIPGVINYLGVFAVKEEVNQEGSTFLNIGATKKGTLYSGEEILKKSENESYKKTFFAGYEVTKKGSESHFWDMFSQNHNEGYWKELIKAPPKQ